MIKITVPEPEDITGIITYKNNKLIKIKYKKEHFHIHKEHAKKIGFNFKDVKLYDFISFYSSKPHSDIVLNPKPFVVGDEVFIASHSTCFDETFSKRDWSKDHLSIGVIVDQCKDYIEIRGQQTTLDLENIKIPSRPKYNEVSHLIEPSKDAKYVIQRRAISNMQRVEVDIETPAIVKPNAREPVYNFKQQKDRLRIYVNNLIQEHKKAS